MIYLSSYQITVARSIKVGVVFVGSIVVGVVDVVGVIDIGGVVVGLVVVGVSDIGGIVVQLVVEVV